VKNRRIAMKLVPLFDKVVLEKEKMEETTKAVVIAVGPGGVVDGKDIKMQVKVGQHVLFSRYSGTEVELEGKKYTVVKQNDILAIVE